MEMELVFTDFQQAFGSSKRRKLMNVLNKIGIHIKMRGQSALVHRKEK